MKVEMVALENIKLGSWWIYRKEKILLDVGWMAIQKLILIPDVKLYPYLHPHT